MTLPAVDGAVVAVLGLSGDEVFAARSRSWSEGPEDEIISMPMKVEKRSCSKLILLKVSL